VRTVLLVTGEASGSACHDGSYGVAEILPPGPPLGRPRSNHLFIAAADYRSRPLTSRAHGLGRFLRNTEDLIEGRVAFQEKGANRGFKGRLNSSGTQGE